MCMSCLREIFTLTTLWDNVSSVFIRFDMVTRHVRRLRDWIYEKLLDEKS